MNNQDYTFWFAMMSLFNTNLSLSNLDRNNEQYERVKRVEQKLDKLLELMDKNE